MLLCLYTVCISCTVVPLLINLGRFYLRQDGDIFVSVLSLSKITQSYEWILLTFTEKVDNETTDDSIFM